MRVDNAGHLGAQVLLDRGSVELLAVLGNAVFEFLHRRNVDRFGADGRILLVHRAGVARRAHRGGGVAALRGRVLRDTGVHCAAVRLIAEHLQAGAACLAEASGRAHVPPLTVIRLGHGLASRLVAVEARRVLLVSVGLAAHVKLMPLHHHLILPRKHHALFLRAHNAIGLLVGQLLMEAEHLSDRWVIHAILALDGSRVLNLALLDDVCRLVIEGADGASWLLCSEGIVVVAGLVGGRLDSKSQVRVVVDRLVDLRVCAVQEALSRRLLLRLAWLIPLLSFLELGLGQLEVVGGAHEVIVVCLGLGVVIYRCNHLAEVVLVRHGER